MLGMQKEFGKKRGSFFFSFFKGKKKKKKKEVVVGAVSFLWVLEFQRLALVLGEFLLFQLSLKPPQAQAQASNNQVLDLTKKRKWTMNTRMRDLT
jgi:hypothetical protein